MIQKSNKVRRKGMILLVVVAFLALFSVMGVTYLIYADSQLRQSTDEVNGQDARQDSMRMVDLNPSFLLNFFLERLIYDQNDITTTSATPDSVYSAIRGHSLARNMYGWNDGSNALNDKPFSGTGKLNKTIPVAGQNIEEWKVVNHTFFNAGDPIIDPERGQRTGVNRAQLTASWNAPYTYPDQNNFYLGWLSSDGTQLIPSFHRDYIFGKTDASSLPGVPTQNPNWTNAVGKYLTTRPRPMDHGKDSFGKTLFPYPESDGFDVKNLQSRQGGNDSLWLDVGSPIFKSPDGRKYKILIAPLILDLDGKVNLNVAGNNMAGGNHGSNQGWGGWEVNPSKIISTDLPFMLNGYPVSGAINLLELPGRFTNANRVPMNGSLTFNATSPSYSLVDYNGATDPTAGTNPSGPVLFPSFNRFPLVNSFQSYPSFPTGNFGNGGNVETSLAGDGVIPNHASFYNPQMPGSGMANSGNRAFTARDQATLLKWNSANSSPSSSILAQLLATSLGTNDPSNPAFTKIRSMITTVSADLNRPGLPPYIFDANTYKYQMAGAFPKASSEPFAGVANRGSSLPGSDYDNATWRSNSSILGKLDLNRKLSDYPSIDWTFTSAVGGNGGRYVNNATTASSITSANSERQKFSKEIFDSLLKLTGAKDMSLSSVPIQAAGATDADYEANRYLAQLAVNIVDYIDNDDVMTEFVWKNDTGTPVDPTKHERVFGNEIKKLVLNEVYAEIVNDPTDTFPEKPANSGMKPASKPFQVHFWVELMNPLPAPVIAGSLSNHAVLEQDPKAAAGDSAVYQLEIRDKSASLDIFKQDNPLGETKIGSKKIMTNFQPGGAGGAALNMVEPAGQNYLGVESAAKGFVVVGSSGAFPQNNPAAAEMPKPYSDINNLSNLKKDELSYTIPEATVGYEKANLVATIQAQKPSMVLRRLANPYLAPQNDPNLANYNPYIAVDVMDEIKVNDGVTNANDDKKAVPPSVDARSSMVRRNPYQDSDKKSVNSLQDTTNNPAPLVKQPQHTFLRQNGTFNDMPGAGINNPDTLLDLPMKWLLHLDRPLVNSMELLQVAGVKPSMVTQNFNNQNIKDSNPTPQVIGHKVPWFDESTRLYRVFEVAQTKSYQSGVAPMGRSPGLININNVWDSEIFRAIADAGPLNNFTENEADGIFTTFKNSRSPSGFPAQNDRPLWGFGLGKADAGDEWTNNNRGIDNSIFRGAGSGNAVFDLPAVDSSGQSRDSVQRKELLNKIFNSVTTRSNTFGVWITTGYFEVVDDTVKPAKLGAEIGKADGTNIRHRMFAIVDRTNLIAGKIQMNASVPTAPAQNVDFGLPNATKLTNPATGALIGLQDGMFLTIEPNTINEETVQLKLFTKAGDPLDGHLVADFMKTHNPSGTATISIVNRGNPGPWAGYDRTKDKDVVIYSEIIE